jgi:hypothetical protein
MRNNRRETILKIAVGAVVGLFLLDRLVISPLGEHWTAQGEKIADLREKVTRGQQLLDREQSIRKRWADMQLTDLPDDGSAAESEIFKGLGRWALASRINFTSLTPQRKDGDAGFETMEYRATTAGDQTAISRLIYEIETDRLPARLEECEITARDAKGQQVTATMRFSFLRLKEPGRSNR